MKRIIFVFCFLVALGVPVTVSAQQCDTIRVPWYDDFGTDSSAALASCWIVSSQGSGYAWVYNNLLRFLMNYGDNYIVALPPVDLPGDSVYFRFQAHYAGNVNVVYGIMTDEADTNSFFLIDTVPLEANNEWIELSFSTIGLGITDTVRLAFKIYASTYSTFELDNFYIDRAAGCDVPTQAWTYFVDTTTATLKWHCYPPYDGFIITLNDSLQYYTPDTLIDIVGLSPNTRYDYSLRAICPDGDMSPEVRGSFRTTCIVAQVPFYEDFQDDSLGTMPGCWMVLRGQQNNVQTTIPSVTELQGNKTIKFRSVTENEIVVATPMLGHHGNALHIGFDAKLYPNTSLTVGLLYNPYNMESFVPLATYEGHETTYSSGLDHYELYTEMIQDTSFAYVAFDWVSVSNGGEGYLDNVSIEAADSCHAPSEVYYLEVGQSSITVAWEDYSIAPQGYEVRFSTTDDVETADSSIFTTNTLYTANNLETNMSYYFWVRSVCDTSMWMPAGYVRTVCSQPLLPYLETFETYQEYEEIPCWEYYHTDSSSSDPYVRSYAIAAQTGPKVWSFGRPYTDTVLVVLPSFGINARNLEVSFWLYLYNGLFEAGVYNSSSGVFTPVLSLLGSSYTMLSQQYIIFQCDTVAAAMSDSRIAFRWSSSPNLVYSSITQAAYIDNLRIRHIPYCYGPDSVEFVGATDSSAILHIHDSWSTGMYRVIYTDGHTVDTAMVVGNDVTITGLQHSTNYSVEVSGYCVDGTMTDPVTGFFSTSCKKITHDRLPYIETFNDYTDGVHISPCWSRYSFSYYFPNYPVPYQGVFYPDSSAGVSMMFIVNSNSSYYYSELLVLPQADYVNDLYVEFVARSNNFNASVDVGIMDNPADLSTFMPIRSILLPTSNTWNHFSVPFNEYYGMGKYIAFGGYAAGSITNGQVYIDNVKVNQLPDCSDSLTWLCATEVGSSYAVLSWNDSPAINDSVQYIVHVLDSAGAELFTDTTVNNPHTLLGLNDLTSYRVYVDLYCDSAVAATTTRQIGFTTQCAANNTIGVGSNTSGTQVSSYLPIVASKQHSVSEQLYRASDLQNTAGMLTDIALYMTSSGSVHDVLNCTIRLGHTSENAMREWVPTDSLQVVYEGPMNFQHGWNVLSLNRPFHYNGTDNLIFSVEGTYVTSTPSTFDYGVRLAFDSASIVKYDTNTIFQNYHNRARFSICADEMEVCQPPTITSLSATDMTVTINYTPTPCEVHITRGWWNRGYTGVMDSTSSHTFEGLDPATQYTIGVRHYCSNGDRSLWTIRRITTEPVEALPPLVMNIDSVTYNSVSVRWRPRSTETRWEVRLFNTLTDVRAVLTDTAYFFDGLNSMVTYYVCVRSLCGSDYSIASEWSDTLTVTTDYCHPVSGVVVSDITETTAHVTWSPSHNSVAWKIEYGYEGFLRGEALGSLVSYTTAIDLDSLERGTSYDLYVASICGPGMSSGWVGSGPFLTAGTSDITVTPDGEGFLVYPNPASSFVTVKLDTDDSKARITIIDQHGRTIATSTASTAVIDVSGFSAGVYFVRISGTSYSSVKKLIVK